MKNILICLVFVAILIPSLSDGQILIGMKGGYDLLLPIGNSNTNPHHDASLDVEKNSYLLSCFAKERRPGKVINFGGEIQYYQANMTGHQRAGGLGAGTIYDYNFTLNFITGIFKPEFVFGSKYRFIINSGAFISLLVKGDATGTWSTYGPPPYQEGTVDDKASKYFNTLSFGFLGGAGFECPLGKRIVFNLSSDGLIGITRLSKITDQFFNLFSFQITGSLAYKINLKQKTGNSVKTDWYEL